MADEAASGIDTSTRARQKLGARRHGAARRGAARPAEPPVSSHPVVLPARRGPARGSGPERLVPGAGLFLAARPMAPVGNAARNRLDRLLGGSALFHAGLIAVLAILYARQARPPPPEDQTAVQMVYGQSGMTGAPVSPDQAGGSPRQQANPPPAEAQPPAEPTAPPSEPLIHPDVPPAPPPVPIPELEPLPPVPPPVEPPPDHVGRQTRVMRVPLPAGPARSRSARASPFSHPMDLSFAQPEPGPARARRGRPSGSGAPVDLSIGPLVKNGQINTPYATVGIKGVSSDYGAAIDSWIRRHLYYPPDAARRGEDGAAHVHVTIDRGGHVRNARLLDSSGSNALDDATTGMFRNAVLPPVPGDMQGDHFDIDLTVNYILTR